VRGGPWRGGLRLMAGSGESARWGAGTTRHGAQMVTARRAREVCSALGSRVCPTSAVAASAGEGFQTGRSLVRRGSLSWVRHEFTWSEPKEARPGLRGRDTAMRMPAAGVASDRRRAGVPACSSAGCSGRRSARSAALTAESFVLWASHMFFRGRGCHCTGEAFARPRLPSLAARLAKRSPDPDRARCSPAVGLV